MDLHRDNAGDGGHHATGTVILFLSFAILAACVCKIIFTQLLKNKVPVPFTVLVLLLGFIVGIIMANINKTSNDFLLGEYDLKEMNPHLIFYIFLPLLIFDSSFNSHFHVIRPQIISGILLAGPGVFICTIVIALCAVYIFPYKWSWIYGLMFGSILSATDPIAVVALLHESGASRSLAALIDLESLLNDGSAFVIFSIFKDIVTKRASTAGSIIGSIFKFTIAGPLFGMACGILSVFVLNMVNNELEIEIISTFGLAYLIFYVADVEIGVSAVLALVVMGLYMSKHKYCISSRVQSPIANTWRIMIYFINILIFIITGIILAHSLVGTQKYVSGRDFGYSILLYVALHVARLLSVLVLFPLISWSGVHLSWREYIVLTWSGLRGSMSVILALIVDSELVIDEATRHRVLFHICMVTLLTLTVNGTSSKFLVRLLGLDHGTPASETVLLQALDHMRKETSEQLYKMKHDTQFAEVDWVMLNEYLPEKLVEKLDEQRKTSFHRRLSLSPQTSVISISTSEDRSKPTTSDIELLEISTSTQSDTVTDVPTYNRYDSSDEAWLTPILDVGTKTNVAEKNLRNEIITRFLTAFAVDYEKQWYIGMIRRPTLYILVESIEKAKHHYSLKLHWDLIVEEFRLSWFLRYLVRYNSNEWINKQIDKLLFDHIFLTIELVLAFHSARAHMENIGVQFPEIASLNQNIWNEVYQETNFYHQMATCILADLQRSYRKCWRMHMTKRCAQMLLKYESTAIGELYKTGILDETERSHILELIEEKLFELEFFRVKMPQGQLKAIENAFDLLTLFRSTPNHEKLMWKTLLKPKHEWFQPEKILIRKDQRISTGYLIVRGIVQCQLDTQTINYRSGNIIGVEILYSQEWTTRGIYSVTGGLLEAYRIDTILLNQLINDVNLAPSVYCEIAFQMLSNIYQDYITWNRLHLKLLLQNKAKLYMKRDGTVIPLKKYDRLLLLAGTVNYSLHGHNFMHKSIEFKVFDFQTDLLLHDSTIAYIWTADDEMYFAKMRQTSVPLQMSAFEAVSNNLEYPSYADSTAESSNA